MGLSLKGTCTTHLSRMIGGHDVAPRFYPPVLSSFPALDCPVGRGAAGNAENQAGFERLASIYVEASDF